MDASIIDTTQQYQETAIKIALGLGVGLLVGLEREWAQKEVGVRTFAIASLTGTLASIVSPTIVPAALIGVFLLVVFLNVHSLLKDRSLEMTTSAALIVMPILGVLVGQGLMFPAAAAAILMTMLLAWKLELARFADALHPEEIRGAVMLALLSVVIFPLLPNRFVDDYQLFNPHQVWMTVMVIAGIGFVNYVLLRLYSRRGLYYAALLGGLVNSTAAVAELAASLRDSGEAVLGSSVAVLLLTSVAMFLRNGLILGIFARAAVPSAMPALAVMSLAAMVFTWKYRDRSGANPPLRLSSPVSFVRVVKFAAVFSALAAVGKLAQQHFGNSGFIVVSIFGGLISSASTTAAAAALVAAQQVAIQAAMSAHHPVDLSIGVNPATGGIATVLASMSSALVNMPLVYQQTHQIALTRRLALITILIVILGIAALLLPIAALATMLVIFLVLVVVMLPVLSGNDRSWRWQLQRKRSVVEGSNGHPHGVQSAQTRLTFLVAQLRLLGSSWLANVLHHRSTHGRAVPSDGVAPVCNNGDVAHDFPQADVQREHATELPTQLPSDRM